ncbi:MAG: hypothetical protein E7264_03560 [Lachnospiraceae bacterium]|nr:hypothetical protein [Lachnospiraceae bacterium]
MKMLRNALLIPGIIFAVLCILHEVSVSSPVLNELNLLWTCFKWCGVGFAFTFVYALLAVQHRWETKSVLKANLFMKIMTLPVHAVCLNLLYGIILDFFARMDYPIVSFLYLWIGSFLTFFSFGIAVTIQSGMIGIAGAVIGKREGTFSKRAAIWYELCSCIPLVDVVTGMIMLGKVKKVQG